MKTPLQTFGPNEHGRDFVIGDLHGSLSVFQNLLKHLNFNEVVDRMFSVCDLIDRGPDSQATLGLVRKPWFKAVLANHEQMMLEAFQGGYMGQFWWQNGGLWGMETYEHARLLQSYSAGTVDTAPLLTEKDMDLLDLLTIVDELPFLITINHKSGKKFHIIHAELPPGEVVTDEILADPDKVRELATQHSGDGESFLWGRYIFYPFYRADLSNREKIIRTVKYKGTRSDADLSHIISGHTILQRPMTVLGQTNIDTCAYGSYGGPKWCALTCIDLDTWTFYQATETDFREVEPFVINRSDLDQT